MNVLSKINPRLLFIGIILFFASIYASISITNHYFYRTFAHDLGIKNQVIWSYAHFEYNYNTVIDEMDGTINVMASHFEPILILLSPFWWLFGSYTLLIFQILFILWGGVGIYKYIEKISGNKLLACLAMAMQLALWPNYAALSYDFHTNVLAAAIVPWLFYSIEMKNWKLFSIHLLLILFCKENMALWMSFVGMGMLIHFRKDKSKLKFGFILILTSIAYFILVMKIIMPYYADGKFPYKHFNYHVLGNTWTEVLTNAIKHPIDSLMLLFEPHGIQSNDPGVYNAKMNFHFYVLLSGGIFLVFRPQFLVMLIPIYGQKMLADDYGKWGIFGQYSIEVNTMIVLAAFHFILLFKDSKIHLLAGFVLFLAAFDTTKEFIGLWKPHPCGKVLTNFWQKSHYIREFDTEQLKPVIEKIPKDAKLSATFYLVPHLADRKVIYKYPIIRDAEYIFLVDDYNHYENTRERFIIEQDSLLHSPYWEKIDSTRNSFLLKRK